MYIYIDRRNSKKEVEYHQIVAENCHQREAHLKAASIMIPISKSQLNQNLPSPPWVPNLHHAVRKELQAMQEASTHKALIRPLAAKRFQ